MKHSRVASDRCVLCNKVLGDNPIYRQWLRDHDPFRIEFPCRDSMKPEETPEGTMHSICAESYRESLITD